MPLLFDFTRASVHIDGTVINFRSGGTGPPVLLLHPQTHVMWHRVAPRLAERFTVVCPDLRGYGDSGKPRSTESHEPYSKRVMAGDQVGLMRTLGFARFAVVGHDRVARVARRMALDHPEMITQLDVLDIVPTHVVYARPDQQHATTVWRYVFLVQPPDLPERLLCADPVFYLEHTLQEWCGTPGALTAEAMAEYRRCFDPATISASCKDYRAGASVDLADDAARRIRCPVLVLWSAQGLGSSYDVLAIWRKEADDVRGRALDCGHFLAEERPDETAAELVAFLSAQR
jgi:haloacetate dehalogenase